MVALKKKSNFASLQTVNWLLPFPEIKGLDEMQSQVSNVFLT